MIDEVGAKGLHTSFQLPDSNFLILRHVDLYLVDAVDDSDAAEVGAGVVADFLEPLEGVFAQVVLRGGIDDHETVAEMQRHQF
jgi:hypothetical protein